MPQPIQQVQIGSLGQLQLPACLPYDVSRLWLFAQDATSLPQAAEVCEAVALQ